MRRKILQILVLTDQRGVVDQGLGEHISDATPIGLRRVGDHQGLQLALPRQGEPERASTCMSVGVNEKPMSATVRAVRIARPARLQSVR